MKDFIPFALHDIRDDDIKAVRDTLMSNWITSGPKVKLFEENFAKYIGVKYAVAVNSATAGLHLALECIGLQQGDKVITTPYTFTATAEVVRYFNADLIFIDIRDSDFNIDPNKIKEFCDKLCYVKNGILYQKGTDAPIKAIIPVHVGGCPCDMDAIMSIAKKYNLKVIEDAAHALPAYYKGRKIGAISDITVFSFYATKTITTGEGGMAVTTNPEYCNRMRLMRLHGINKDIWDRYSSEVPSWYYEVVEAGFKYNMTDIAASLGIQQLKKADMFYERRKAIAARYQEELRGVKNIELPRYDTDGHSWHLYIIKVESKRFERDEFVKKMYENGIGVSVHFIPLHLHPYYKNKYNFAPDDFPVAYDCFRKVVSLPIHTRLRDVDIVRIIGAIKELSS